MSQNQRSFSFIGGRDGEFWHFAYRLREKNGAGYFLFHREVTDDLSCLLKDRHMDTEMTQQAWSSRQWESGGPGTPCGVLSPGR